MPVNDLLLKGMINSGIQNPAFNNLDGSQKGVYINNIISEFQDKYATDSNDDTAEINKIAADTYQQFKQTNNQERTSLNQEDFPKYGTQLVINPQDNKDTQIQSIKDWESQYTKSAAEQLPALADDIKTQVGQIADNEIRKVASKDDWMVHDLTNRTIGGAIKPLFDLLGQSRAFESSYVGRTNPEHDSDFSSQVFSGIGTIASLAAIGSVTGGLGDLVGIGKVAGSTIGTLGYFNTTMMHDAYKMELDRSGDPDKAFNNAISQIPAASIQAIGDMAIMRLGLGELIPDLKGFKTQWLAASTDEAKQAVIKAVIPTIGREAVRGGLIGAGGMVAQESLSGIGSYYATGDEKYLRSFEQIVTSGAVGGVLGALTGAAFSGHAQDLNRAKIAEAITDVSTNQKAIFDLLQKGDYKGVVDLYANNFITPETKPEPINPLTPAKTKTNRAGYRVNDIQFEAKDVDALKNTPIPSPDDPNFDNLKAEYDRRMEMVKHIEEGTLPLKTSSTLSVPNNDIIGAPLGPHTVTLEDGSNLNDHVTDLSQKVVYVNDKIMTQRVTHIGVDNGEVTLIPAGDNKAVFAVQTVDGKFQQGKQKFETSTTPKEGWTPIVITDSGKSDLSPVPADHTRFYHGGVIDPSKTGKWVTPDLTYAQGYANKTQGAVVQYVDVPNNHPLLRKAFDDSAPGMTKAPYIAFDAPTDLMQKAKVIGDRASTQRSIQVLPVVKTAELNIAHPDYTHVETFTQKNGKVKSVAGKDSTGNIISVKPDTELGKQLLKQEADAKAITDKQVADSKALSDKKKADELRQSIVDENRGFFAEPAKASEPGKATLEEQLPRYVKLDNLPEIQSPELKLTPTPEDLKTLAQKHTEQLNNEIDQSLSKMAEVSDVEKEMRLTAMNLAMRDENGKFRKNITPEEFTARVAEINKLQERNKPISKNDESSRFSLVQDDTDTSTHSQTLEQDIKNHIKKVFGVDVKVEDTNETVRDGKQWNGRADKDGSITLNRRNIGSVEEAERIFREELGHHAYGDESLNKLVNTLIDSIPDPLAERNKFLAQGYRTGETTEEATVKRVNDLLDQWKQRGKLDQIYQAIKTWAKEKLGMSLTDKDLQVLASRLIERGLANYKSGKGISERKYQLGELAPEDEFKRNLADEDYSKTKEYFDSLSPQEQKVLNDKYNGDALGFARQHFEQDGPLLLGDNKNINEGGITLSGDGNDLIQARKEALGKTKDLVAKLKSLRNGGKNYQPLVNLETPLANKFKGIDYNFLSNESLNEYHNTLNDFVNSRSKVKDPTTERTDVGTLDKKLTDLIHEANQGKFNEMAEDYPKAFGDKTFANFGGDIDVVTAYLQDFQNVHSGDLSGGGGAVNKVRLATEQVIRDMQDELHEDGALGAIKDVVYKYTNELKDFDNFIKTAPQETVDFVNSHPVITEAFRKFSEVIKEHGSDAEKMINEVIDYALHTDPSELTNMSDVLKLKYLIQAFRTDGYFPYINTFISAEMKGILHTEGIQFQDGAVKKGGFYEKVTANIEGTQAKIDRVAANKESAHFVHKLRANLSDSYNRAQRAHLDFLVPVTDAVNRKWVAARGGRGFNDTHLNQMGIFAILRQRYMDESPNEAIAKNLKWLDDSFNNHLGSNDKFLVRAAKEGKEFIEKIKKDINLDSTEDQRSVIEKNFTEIKELGPEAFGYIKDMQKIFDVMTPLSRMTSEFAYGKEFHEIENYFPSFSLPVGGTFEDNKSIMYNGEGDILSPVDSYAIGSKGFVSIDSSRKGMSSIKLRDRVVPEGRRLVLNINNMIMNRGRLNLLDHFTALRRREMSNVLKSRQFSRFLGDVHVHGDKEFFDQRGRTDMMRRAFNQEWVSQIQANSYLGTWQSVLNGLTRRFSVAKLASIYRAPVHILGNLTSYIGSNPGKTLDLFKSFAAMLEAHRNPAYRDFLDRLFFESRKRDQQFNLGDVAFDRSTTIKLTPDDNIISRVAQGISESKVWQGITKVDAVIQRGLFAPLKWSDQSSGNAIMLTEFLHNERERTNNPNLQFKDLVLNSSSSVSYHKALIEMERHVSISDASRRGLWMNNTNPSISLLRNLTMAFAGKKIMNATNFTVAMHNLTHGSMTPQDKAATWRFMGGIMAQTAMFQLVKWTIQNMTGQAILNISKNDTDDSLEQYYKKQAQSDSLTPRQKVMLEQEISTRRKLRSAINNMEGKFWDKSTLGLEFAKDTLPNMLLIPSLLSGQVDGIIHLTYDAHETAVFEEMKKGELERLQHVAKNAKEQGNLNLYSQVRTKMSDLESQKAHTLINQHENYQNLSGIIGEFLNNNYQFGKSVVGSILQTHEIYPSDIINITSAYGIGFPEAQKMFSIQKQLQQPRDEDPKKLQQKLQKLQQAGNNY